MKRSIIGIVCVVLLSVILLGIMIGSGYKSLNKPTIGYTYCQTKTDKYRTKTVTVWQGINRVTTDVTMERLHPATLQWKTVDEIPYINR